MPRLTRLRLQHPIQVGQAELGPDSASRPSTSRTATTTTGWFDYSRPQPGRAVWPVAPHASARPTATGWRDCAKQTAYDWRTVHDGPAKEESGHETPWFAYLAGDNPGYPEAILAAAPGSQIRHRLRICIDRDTHLDPPEPNIHRWQLYNPVATEALLQFTTGAHPAALQRRSSAAFGVRYHDAQDRGRPGLPPDVAALVDTIDPERPPSTGEPLATQTSAR